MIRLAAAVVLTAALLVCPCTSSAQAPASADTFVNAGSKNTNYGTNANLTLRTGGSATKGFIRFDLSRLPATATSSGVSRATMRLFANTVSTAGNFDVLVVMSPWTEAGITFNSTPSLGPTAVLGVPVTVANSYVLVDVTSLVQLWLAGAGNGGIANNGLALAPSSGSSISVQFDSKESGTTSHDPELEIDYVDSSITNGLSNLQTQLNQEIVNRQGTDNSALAQANAYTNSQLTGYATLATPNSFNASQTIAGSLGVSGSVSGAAFSAGSAGTASGTNTGYSSGPLDLTASVYNGSNAANKTFRWQVEPSNAGTPSASGTINLLFGSGTNAPAETGLSIANNGVITFAPGQVFPGAQVSGGISESQVTNLTNDLAGKASLGGAYSDPSWITALSGSKITGTVANAILAATATNATNALALGGVPAGSFATLGGNYFNGNQTIQGQFQVINGSIVTNGGIASTSAGSAGVYGQSNSGAMDAGVLGRGPIGIEGIADGPTSIAGVLNATNGAKILSGQYYGTEVFRVDNLGKVTSSGTAINAGGTASGTTTGYNSGAFDLTASVYDGASATAQTFRWQAEPSNAGASSASGTLNLLFGPGANAPTETGLSIASNGLITFAPGQTFAGAQLSGGIPESQITNLTGDLASKASLTGSYADPAWITALAGSKITGTVANSTNASNLGNAAAANYARLDIGNSFAGNQNVAGTLNASAGLVGQGTCGGDSCTAGVTGSGYFGLMGTGAIYGVYATSTGGPAVYASSTTDAGINASGIFGVEGNSGSPSGSAGYFNSTNNAKILRGGNNFVEVYSVDSTGKVTSTASAIVPAAIATGTSTGFNSGSLDLTASVYNGTNPANQTFRWQAEPVNAGVPLASGSMNLLFGAGANAPTETGLSIASNGVITFAPGQTFGTIIQLPNSTTTDTILWNVHTGTSGNLFRISYYLEEVGRASTLIFVRGQVGWCDDSGGCSGDVSDSINLNTLYQQVSKTVVVRAAPNSTVTGSVQNLSSPGSPLSSGSFSWYVTVETLQ